MYTTNKYTLSMLCDALTRRKGMEDRINECYKRNEPALSFIAELHSIYADTCGRDEVQIAEGPMSPIKKKPKTQKEVLFSDPVVEVPAGAKWPDITISFQNSHDVKILYKDVMLGTYSYEQLNFDKRNTTDNPPNKLWALLRVLAVGAEYKSDVEIILTKEHLMDVCGVVSENAVEKQKSDLAKGLRSALGIQESPFETYTPEKGYQTKFILRPEPDMRGDGRLHRSGVVNYNDKIYQ